MRNKMTLIALLGSASLLYGCGGSMLGSSDAEDHKLVPDVVTEDPNPQRPTAGLPVIRASGDELLYQGKPTSFHGINLQYADDPLGRYPGIKAIGETGSNIVRIILKSTTTTGDLEAALNGALSSKLVVILSLADPALACSDDETLFTSAVQATWLKAFLPIIHRDQYQNNLMINIASGWGPKDIFNGYSTGYKTYIDNYKTAIRAFRKAGFQLPLVIDAPCGTDYYAFSSDRGKELLAADDEKNLVLSVHGYGSYWDSNSEIDTALSVLRSQKMPFIMSEFGGSGVGEDAINHKALIARAAGDNLVALDVPWKASNDKVGIVFPFEAPIDLTNTEISFDMAIPAAYQTDGQMGYQLYLRDINGEYANLQWIGAWSFTPDTITHFKYKVKNKTSFGWASDAFDITQVAKVGIEFVANGKAADVAGAIKFDSFKVVEGAAAEPETTYYQDFATGTDNWANTQWEGKNTIISNDGSGHLSLVPEADVLEVGRKGLTSEGVDFSEPVLLKTRIYIPASFTAFYLSFYATEASSWTAVGGTGEWALAPGTWHDIEVAADFSGAGGTGVGIQIVNFPAGAQNADPVLIDSFEIVSVPKEDGGAVEFGTQYRSNFSSDTDGWVNIAWGGAKALTSVADGVMTITPDAVAEKFNLNKSDLASVTKLDLTGPVEVGLSIKLPVGYAGKDYSVQLLMQDSTYNVDIAKTFTADQIPVGEWVQLIWNVDFVADLTKGTGFNREATPTHFVLQVNTGSSIEPVQVSEITIKGNIPVEKEEVVVASIDFIKSRNEAATAEADIVEGGLTIEDLGGTLSTESLSDAFSWLAWSWFGNSAEESALDLTTVVSDPGSLTARGEEIVKGRGGIKDFAPVEQPAP